MATVSHSNKRYLPLAHRGAPNHLTIPTVQKEDAVKLWGHPTTFKDIADLFQKFCSCKLSALPWSDQPVLSETSVISKQLARVNALGFLTINSQPAVNGVRSDDKMFGWGPSNGYVYQKAYLEFFASPELLDSLITHIERDPGTTYYVINKRGDLRTNTTSDGPNAVTWGVFPGKEVVQPTIVEAISFMAWKVLQFHTSATGIRSLTIALQDEAYELGYQWAKVYEAGSPSRKLISNLMNNALLVNIVHNDFHDQYKIFEPFFKLEEELSAKAAAASNGHAVIDDGLAN
jgi:methylenetetrahydrofolate reductase (NADPH)